MYIENGALRIDTLQLRGGTAAHLKNVNPLLKEREVMIETSSGRMKIGDGEHCWNDLPYAGGLSEEKLSMTLIGENETTIMKEVAIWN